MLVEPDLEVRVGPRFVEPVTRIGSGCADLLSCALIIFTCDLFGLVGIVWLWCRDAITVEEGLEVRV